MMQRIDTPVLIAGGGPVGMTMALFLARYGVKSLLVERNPTTTNHPKMDLTNGRSMELFRQIGLVGALRDAGVPRENPFDISWITSLAGHELHRFVYPSANAMQEIIAKENSGSHAREAPLRISQVAVEPVLKRLIDRNSLIDVRFNTVFERIVEQNDACVVAELRDGSSGGASIVRASFLVGCEGGGSRIRRQLDIDLDGNMAVGGAYMVHFRTRARDVVQRWGITWHYQNGKGSLIAQNDDDIYTLQAWLPPGVDPQSVRPEDVLESWVGRKFDYEILQANPWTANLVVAQRFVKQRVALAGDSAHQFIPTGGYGMNSGIADAAGLSWMLAALLQGWGGPKLLEAHDAERRPTAWWHLAASQRHMGVRMEIAKVYAEAGDLEGTGSDAAQRRAQVALKLANIGNAENESWGVELGYRYDESPIVASEADPPPIDPNTYRPTTWPGSRLPHIFLEPGVSIHDRLGPYFTLVNLGSGETAPLERAASERRVPLTVLTLNRAELRAIYDCSLLLVRPDQHIAWRGDVVPYDCHGLIARICGH